jgi:hypothetical protein
MVIIIKYNPFMSALMLLELNLKFLLGKFGNNVKNEDPDATPIVFPNQG